MKQNGGPGAEKKQVSIYEKPGSIQNESLLKVGRSIQLKPNVVEHFDYEAVS